MIAKVYSATVDGRWFGVIEVDGEMNFLAPYSLREVAALWEQDDPAGADLLLSLAAECEAKGVAQ